MEHALIAHFLLRVAKIGKIAVCESLTKPLVYHNGCYIVTF